MKKVLVLAAFALLLPVTEAAAQHGVPAQWTRSGSAVCPKNYVFDARRGGCFPVYRYGGIGQYYRGAGGGAVQPRWTRSGSAVCPRNYDFVASRGACLPRY